MSDHQTLITGATGGMGGALARRLKRAGHAVFLTGRDPVELETLANELDAPTAVADLTDPVAVKGLFERVAGDLPGLDQVAHCAGAMVLKPARSTTDEDWAKVIHTNLSSAFYVLREAVDLMKRGGSLVFVSSAAAMHGFPHHEAIAAAKAGVIGLVRSAAASYARRKIRVNCVAPGMTRTPMTSFLTENEAALKSSLAMHALGRIGEPDEIAAALEFLLNHEWITGQVLGVDGGLGSVFSRAG